MIPSNLEIQHRCLNCYENFREKISKAHVLPSAKNSQREILFKKHLPNPTVNWTIHTIPGKQYTGYIEIISELDKDVEAVFTLFSEDLYTKTTFFKGNSQLIRNRAKTDVELDFTAISLVTTVGFSLVAEMRTEAFPPTYPVLYETHSDDFTLLFNTHLRLSAKEDRRASLQVYHNQRLGDPDFRSNNNLVTANEFSALDLDEVISKHVLLSALIANDSSHSLSKFINLTDKIIKQTKEFNIIYIDPTEPVSMPLPFIPNVTQESSKLSYIVVIDGDLLGETDTIKMQDNLQLSEVPKVGRAESPTDTLPLSGVPKGGRAEGPTDTLPLSGVPKGGRAFGPTGDRTVVSVTPFSVTPFFISQNNHYIISGLGIFADLISEIALHKQRLNDTPTTHYVLYYSNLPNCKDPYRIHDSLFRHRPNTAISFEKGATSSSTSSSTLASASAPASEQKEQQTGKRFQSIQELVPPKAKTADVLPKVKYAKQRLLEDHPELFYDPSFRTQDSLLGEENEDNLLMYDKESAWYRVIINHHCEMARYKIAACVHIGNMALLSEVQMALHNLDVCDYSVLYMIHIPSPISEQDIAKIINIIPNFYLTHCADKMADFLPSAKNAKREPFGCRNAIITTAANRGMDLGGFMVQMDFLLRNDISVDTIIKIHTKSDRKWRRNLLISLLGNTKTIENNVEALASLTGAETGEQDYVVVIPEKHLHDATADNYNAGILDFYKMQYGWATPDFFSAGTMFMVPWNILNYFWRKISFQSPRDVYYLFKSHYVTNKRESYAHAWERILSGYIPYNYPALPRALCIPYRASYQSPIYYKQSFSSQIHLKSESIFEKLYQLQKLSYVYVQERSNLHFLQMAKNQPFYRRDAPDKNLEDKLQNYVNANAIYWSHSSYEDSISAKNAYNVYFETTTNDCVEKYTDYPSEKMRILWLRYENSFLLENAASCYDLIITDEPEAKQALEHTGVSVSLLNPCKIITGPVPAVQEPPDKLSGPVASVQAPQESVQNGALSPLTLHNLLFNRITKNATGKNVTIRVYCGEDVENMHCWGDYLLARNLKYELEQLGCRTLINCEYPFELLHECDITIDMGGYNKFPASPINRSRSGKNSSGGLRILWFYSHPDEWLSDLSQFRPYDVIMVASLPMIQKLRTMEELTDYKIVYLPQVFVHSTSTPLENSQSQQQQQQQRYEKHKYKFSFIGNSRNIYRPAVKYVLQAGVKLNIWGRGWHDLIPFEYQKRVKLRWVNNERLGQILRDSYVILNDHWEDMRQEGFVSMKTFEFMANRVFFVTDKVCGLEFVSSDIVYYEDGNHLKQLLKSVDTLDFLPEENLNQASHHDADQPKESKRTVLVNKLYKRYCEIRREAVLTLQSVLKVRKFI
jgi:hypothetical protein